ncbi:MAG: LacI family DNA-binding transcriptional regulator, partial [bacterium]
MKPTLRYIAERANVSIGTVDRVIHDRGRVSEETQNRVRAIIEEIGYSPNIFASNLSTSRVHRFAAILPHTNDNADHWGLHRRGLTAAARELSRMNVEFTEIPFELTSTGSFVRACTEAVAGDFSGYVLVSPAQSEVAEEWALRFSATSPVVLVDSDLPKLDSVYFRGQNPVESGRDCGRLLNYMLPAESKVVLA